MPIASIGKSPTPVESAGDRRRYGSRWRNVKAVTRRVWPPVEFGRGWSGGL